MTGLLSAISGKFSSALILGTLFPVTVFVILVRVLLVPLLPVASLPVAVQALAALDEKWEILVLTLAVLVLSGLLYNLNTPHIRFYEGYPWQDTRVGHWMKDRRTRELSALLAEREGLAPLAAGLRKEIEILVKAGQDESDPEVARLRSWIADIGRREGKVLADIFGRFPKTSSVLPTRLGNTIRSAENYSERQYNMASISLWPRLIAVINKSYAEVMDASKANLDFMLNAATLSGLLAALLLITGLLHPVPLVSGGAAVRWLLEIAIFAALAWWLSAQAVGRAAVWGNLIRGAFDLYRGDLLKQLGYSRTPKTPAEERELWNNISSRLIAGDPPKGKGELLSYVPEAAPPAAHCRPRDLELLRGVSPLSGEVGLQIVLEVRNPGQTTPKETVVADTVPEGYDFQWKSETVDEGTVSVTGINPYRFRLSSPPAPGETRQVEYRIVPRDPQGEAHGV